MFRAVAQVLSLPAKLVLVLAVGSGVLLFPLNGIHYAPLMSWEEQPSLFYVVTSFLFGGFFPSFAVFTMTAFVVKSWSAVRVLLPLAILLTLVGAASPRWLYRGWLSDFEFTAITWIYLFAQPAGILVAGGAVFFVVRRRLGEMQ